MAPIFQVWFRVNGLLPDGLQKSLPDRPPEIPQQNAAVHGGNDILLMVFVMGGNDNKKLLCLNPNGISNGDNWEIFNQITVS